jgi:hypothetical protein
MLFHTSHSSLILVFHCMNGADWTGTINMTRTPGVATHPAPPSTYARCKLVGVSIVVCIRTLRTYLEERMAAPVWSYCFTIEMELIGPAVLNGAPLKHNANDAGT